MFLYFILCFCVNIKYFATINRYSSSGLPSLRVAELITIIVKVMNDFHLPDSNPYEDRVRQFLQTKKGQALQTYYDSSPYEEENGVFDSTAMVASYVCNGISAITGSTYVFSYFFFVFHQLPSPSVIAGFITATVLITLEVLQRWFSSKFFKSFYKLKLIKNGMRLYGLTLRGFGVGMVICAAISILFSYNGSFDFLTTVTNPPEFVAPELINIADVQARYDKKITEAQEAINDYSKRREWNGRLSTVDSKKYVAFTDRKLALDDESLAEVKKAETKNENTLASAKVAHEEAVALYESKAKTKGGGLAVIAILSILVFFLCMWFQEHYKYKTILQYAVIPDTQPQKKLAPANPCPTPLGVQAPNQPDLLNVISQIARDMEDLKKDRGGMVDLRKDSSYSHNGNVQEENSKTKQRTIGFLNRSDLTHEKKFSSNGIPTTPQNAVYTDVHTSTGEISEGILHIMDRFTIEHRNFSNGKVQHLNYQTVQNRIGDYAGRVEEATKKGDSKALANRKVKLAYWESRRAELLAKAQAAV